MNSKSWALLMGVTQVVCVTILSGLYWAEAIKLDTLRQEYLELSRMYADQHVDMKQVHHFIERSSAVQDEAAKETMEILQDLRVQNEQLWQRNKDLQSYVQRTLEMCRN